MQFREINLDECLISLVKNAQYPQFKSLIEIIKNNDNDIIRYCYLGLIYLIMEDIETADYVWMSILLETDNFDDNLQILVDILNQEGVKKIQNNQLKIAFNIYSKIEELINEFEQKKNEWAIYYFNFAIVWSNLGDKKTAFQLYLQAIEINNYFTPAYNNLGYICANSDNGNLYNPKEAELYYKKAINLDSQYEQAYLNLFILFHTHGKERESLELAEKVSDLFPQSLFWKLARFLITPFVYEKVEDIDFYRRRFNDGVEEILRELNTREVNEEDVKAFSKFSIFNLTYQGLNDRELQQKYGQLISKVMEKNFPHLDCIKSEKKSLPTGKIKVGYLSNCFCSHTVAKFAFGWFEHHNREDFEIYCYSINSYRDQFTEQFKSYSDYFHELPQDIQTVAQTILDDELDILVFIEIGMTPIISQIASLRLCSIQCATYLHPTTTGLKNIDYFLSSDLIEPNNAVEHYCEKLIRLPNIGVCYPKNRVLPLKKTRRDFGLREDSIVYFCCQSLFKYLPQHDYLFPSIAKKLPSVQFVFVNRPNPSIGIKFKQRLCQVFREFDLDIDDYCVVLPPLRGSDFNDINLLCDIFLDSIGWSGGGTTLDAIAYGLPIVTLPGELMRGRQSYGILKMLGVTETIANSELEYIDIAVRLGIDKVWREKIKEKIKANHHNLYEDLECVRGLEKFYHDVMNKIL